MEKALTQTVGRLIPVGINGSGYKLTAYTAAIVDAEIDVLENDASADFFVFSGHPA